MKRNRLFLGAYIVFIFFCAIVKCFWDFPLWNAFVVAVTTASGILALADLFYIQGKHWKANAEEQYRSSEEALLEVELINNALSKRLRQLNNSNDNTLHSKEDDIAHYKNAQDSALGFQKQYLLLKSDACNQKTTAKAIEICSNVFTILGYLSLFSILIFEPLASVLFAFSDMITICSFGIILLTQLIDDICEERLNKLVQQYTNLRNALDALRKNYETEVKYNAN